MIFDKNGNITVITQEAIGIVEMAKKLDGMYERFKNDNVIINLSSIDPVSLEEILEFLPISNRHRSANNSFVIVCDRVNFAEMPDEIVVVPTLQEAYDIIEMEEMERDLGL